MPDRLRIAYVCYWDLESRDGVARKIRSQIAAWRVLGHEVGLFNFPPSRPTQRWRSMRKTVAAASALRPDLVYLRNDIFPPGIGDLVSRETTVVEVNTDMHGELPARGMLHARYASLNERTVLRRAAGLVCVTEELARRYRSLGRPVAVVGNGCDFGLCTPSPPPGNDRPRLICVGAGACQYWQGYDKLVRLARLRPDWDFDLIGPTHVELPSAPDNMKIHGFLPPDDYAPLLARADVAVGPLALHRKGMDEASPLKLAEYLASGLPTIVGSRVAAFEAPRWFLEQLPNEEDNIESSLDRIDRFLSRVRGQRVPRAEVAELNWAVIEPRRLAFFHSVVGSRGGEQAAGRCRETSPYAA